MLSVFFSILLASPVEVYERYDDNMVIRMNIDSAMAAERLDTVINQNPSYSVWSDAELGNVDIMIPKANMDDLKSKLNGVDVQVLIPNLQDLIDRETEHSAKHSALVTKVFQSRGVIPSAQELFKDYQDSDVYLAFLESLPETTPISIGTSFEGRKIRGVKFGNGPKNIVFHGGIHAREWITGAVTTFIAHQLLGNSTEAVELRSKFTFSVIPVLNVDGYAYSRTRKRLWRKNRQETWDFSCFGIDINRNFPYKWRNGGSSGDECKETFRGEKPLEAQESIALYEYVKSLENVVSYIDFHSYSQIWMLPYGYSCDETAKDTEVLLKGAKLAVETLKSVNNVKFDAGPLCNVLYRASGVSIDTMYNLGVKFSYTVELRDTGGNGFILPAKEILPSGRETTKAVFALFDFVSRN